jgi:outer membrane protein assembly factor BamA
MLFPGIFQESNAKSLILYDSLENTNFFIVRDITISGNSITKRSYILRELTFKEGDTILQHDINWHLNQSRKNLLNTSLFLSSLLSLSYRMTDSSHISIIIQVKERWYLWPEPVIENAERNFNTWWLNRDFSKLNYGVQIIQENFRGQNERLSLVIKHGFDQKYEFAYQKPGINKEKTIGLAAIIGLKNNRVVAFESINNKRQFLQLDVFLKKEFYDSSELIFRPNINTWHYFQLNFNRLRFHDTLLIVNPSYSLNENKNPTYFGFQYFLKVDHRDMKPYPLSGYYFDATYNQSGLGLIKKDQRINISVFTTNIRGFLPLSSRFYYAAGMIGKYSTPEIQPLFFEEGLGYGRAFVRGYEYYVMNAASYFVLKQNIKFALIPQKDIPLSFNRLKKVKFLRNLPYQKFEPFFIAVYTNLFLDYGITNGVNFEHNKLTNKNLLGCGIGFDFVTYYDKVLRIETAINHLGEKGIYIHFIAPI